MFTIFIKLWTETRHYRKTDGKNTYEIRNVYNIYKTGTETPYDIKIWIKTEEDRKTYEKPNAYYIYKAMEKPYDTKI